ncbi:hypothetical protein [Oryza sativa Japonica Group]|uniref:Uncharacterized protein n=1 Tax=Oryza sativa subsp. japonica TaxID=39947 RepID=Q5NB24_ORYSJ|nr:hypothetical protein [Oryza sativa Japonica Group]BAD86863.1 hypothetical protein [Oryza sativa Japonica Group]
MAGELHTRARGARMACELLPRARTAREFAGRPASSSPAHGCRRAPLPAHGRPAHSSPCAVTVAAAPAPPLVFEGERSGKDERERGRRGEDDMWGPYVRGSHNFLFV